MCNSPDCHHDLLDFSDLEDEAAFNQPAANAGAARETFPCQSCAGTGKYRGVRVHQERADCFACGGRGYFLTSPHQRKKSRAYNARRKERAVEAALASVSDEVRATLEHAEARGFQFAASLMDQMRRGKLLSDKQIAAANGMHEKAVAREAERAAEREKAAVATDLGPIITMFDRARESGYKKPRYRAAGLVISLAPATGRNAGALYVKRIDDDTYIGKVAGDRFHPVRDCTDADKVALAAIAVNPAEEAVRYGQRTGTCSCCGRELTNHGSIERGIGPICAERWGL